MESFYQHRRILFIAPLLILFICAACVGLIGADIDKLADSTRMYLASNDAIYIFSQDRQLILYHIMQIVFTKLLGCIWISERLPALLCITATAIALWQFAKRHIDHYCGWIASVLYITCPAFVPIIITYGHITLTALLHTFLFISFYEIISGNRSWLLCTLPTLALTLYIGNGFLDILPISAVAMYAITRYARSSIKFKWFIHCVYALILLVFIIIAAQYLHNNSHIYSTSYITSLALVCCMYIVSAMHPYSLLATISIITKPKQTLINAYPHALLYVWFVSEIAYVLLMQYYHETLHGFWFVAYMAPAMSLLFIHTIHPNRPSFSRYMAVRILVAVSGILAGASMFVGIMIGIVETIGIGNMFTFNIWPIPSLHEFSHAHVVIITAIFVLISSTFVYMSLSYNMFMRRAYLSNVLIMILLGLFMFSYYHSEIKDIHKTAIDAVSIAKRNNLPLSVDTCELIPSVTFVAGDVFERNSFSGAQASCDCSRDPRVPPKESILFASKDSVKYYRDNLKVTLIRDSKHVGIWKLYNKEFGTSSCNCANN